MSRNRPLPWARHVQCLALVALAAALLPGRAAAQQTPTTGQGSPHLLLVQPPGGQAGTTVEVTLIGQNLEQVQGLYFSRPGLRAELLETTPVAVAPTSGKKKRGGMKGPPAKGVRFRVHIPADTPVGTHDVRVLAEGGISNARAFVVGDLKEYVEKEPNNDVPQAQRVELGCAVHGAISNPTDVDYFRFAGRKGQRVVIHCAAASIDSKLEPEVGLYGPDGALLAHGRDYGRGEALCDALLPADGDYDVRVCSFGYVLGGPDYFYRLSLSTAPWIDAVFPPVVEPGKTATVTVYGRNLPGGAPDPAAVADGRVLEKATVTVDVPADPQALQRLRFGGRIRPAAAALDGFELRLRTGAGTSNPFLLTYAQAPVVLDRGDNDTPERAQEVQAPCEVAGRIEKKGDRDWYAFTATKGQVYSVEAYGERLGAPLDLQLSVRRAGPGKTQSLAELDDNPEVFLPQVLTRTDDPPRFRFVAPADGRYLVGVASTESYAQAGPRHLYRLRLAPERPDFRLVAFPPVPNALDTCVVPEGGHQLFTLLVWRLDGFNGEIRLTAEGLPEGVRCRPQVVPAGSKLGFLVLSAARGAPPWAGEIHIKGEALVGGKEVVREVRPAGATWPVPQINLPAVCRLDRNLVLSVRGPSAYVLTAGEEPKSALPGQKVTVPLRLARNWPEVKGKAIQVTALSVPQALTFQQTVIGANKDTADAAFQVKPNAEPGTYVVVLRGQLQVNKKNKKKQTNLNLQLPSTPITVTVLPKELAKLTVPGGARVRPGGEAEVLVRVARLHNYEGPFRVRLVMPPGSQGLEADEVTVPAGANEARLVIRAAPEARPGPRPNLIVRAVGMFNGRVPTKQETKVNVTVVK